MALLASVWARKPHQALLLSYLLVGLWIAAAPVVLVVFYARTPPTVGTMILAMSNPILAAFATDISSPAWTLGLGEQVAYFLVAVLIATGQIGLAIRWLRPMVLAQVSRPVKRERPDAPARLVDYLPGPSLDGNAVLWREWHRKRPSRWTGRFWTAYAIASTLASVYVLGGYYLWSGDPSVYGDIHVVAAHVNAWQVAIGLLLLSVSAATTLAEERDRGSLEVIMATPLTTREIVWGKWWGTFAMVPRLAILPIWVAAGSAMVSDGGVGVILMIGLILAYAAAITSAGLALATWVPRLGRVISINVLGLRHDHGRLACAAARSSISIGVAGEPLGTAAGMARTLPGKPVLRHLLDDRAGGSGAGRLELVCAFGLDRPVFERKPALGPLLDRRILHNRDGADVRDGAHL